ncbi:SRPBCC domain-containing protein [Niabella ginsengisoli]|uniref:SRPBCC domain-containing protein n=1 Tax=Niabella ginsengisoli TaxID=522298 RepID=A0ABS9SED5_9BACT|nr:SRPBCC domain-containing protein [Niabella ginsengisoli]MCH5596718.1 SRPBCC domain-containing protein [Niabella ginsengisoli]
MEQKVIAKASIGIQKPVSEIFEAIVDPEIMKHYFISKGSGKMEQGASLNWSFPEYDGSYPLTVSEVRENEKIVFVWDPQSIVTIELEERADNDTVIKVFEEGHELNEKGVKWAIGQTEGWSNFLACMKAWLEHGIHLRKGAFDFMKKGA